MRSYPSAQRSLAMRLWYDGLRRVCQVGGTLVYGCRCSGRENIPSEGGVLVISNHQSHFDPPLVGLGCMRRMNYLARETLFDITPLRLLINTLDAIPINRDGLGIGGIKETLKRLKRGEMVLMFPEGTRTRNGEIGPFRPGFTTLAVRSGAMILPVAIEGAFDVWPRTRGFPKLTGMIHIRYGPPMLPDEIGRFAERELIAEVRRRVQECLDVSRKHPDFAHRRRLSGQRHLDSAVPDHGIGGGGEGGSRLS